MKLLKSYVFNRYPLYVYYDSSVSKYIIKGEKIAKAIYDKIGIDYVWSLYCFNIKEEDTYIEILVDKKNNKPITHIRGTTKTGRRSKISGQKLHEMNISAYERSLIMHQLKEYFLYNMKKQGTLFFDETAKYFFDICFVLDRKYISSGVEYGDLDNHELFYKKALFDCLASTIYNKQQKKFIVNEVGFLPNDSIIYINDYRIRYLHSSGANSIILNIYNKNSYDKNNSIESM
jgi:hypothetical protein